jgi:hypothetical protein
MTERELSRRARHRLAVLRHVEEVSGCGSRSDRQNGTGFGMGEAVLAAGGERVQRRRVELAQQ